MTEAQLDSALRWIEGEMEDQKGDKVIVSRILILDLQEIVEDYRAVVRQVTHPRSVQEQLDPKEAADGR